MPNTLNIIKVTSTKEDGNLSLRLESPEVVFPRREAFLAKYGIRSEDCVFIDTEHGDKIVHVGISDKGKSISTEALITKDPNVVLYLLTADCFPVTFYDSKKQILALAHMGWRPTDKLLATKVIEEMKSVYDSKPEDIQIFIGPGIHKESYKFIDSVQKQIPAWSDFLTDSPDGETQIDILGYIQEQVIRSGVLQEHVDISPIDTATSAKYFSHYRSVRTGEAEGRFATIFGMVDELVVKTEGQ